MDVQQHYVHGQSTGHETRSLQPWTQAQSGTHAQHVNVNDRSSVAASNPGHRRTQAHMHSTSMSTTGAQSLALHETLSAKRTITQHVDVSAVDAEARQHAQSQPAVRALVVHKRHAHIPDDSLRLLG